MTTAAGDSFLSRARLQLMLAQPYLSSAVARLPFVEETTWCQTLATDGYYIYVNPAFARTLEDTELQAVIAHELLHCVLGHIDRRMARDRTLWNVAIDLATNLLLVDLGFDLPKQGLLDPGVRGMTAEQIYERLLNDPDYAIDMASQRGGDVGVEAPPSAPSEEAVPSASIEDGDGWWDKHVEPGDPEGASHRAADYPTEIERKRMRRELASDLASQLPGHAAGLLTDEIAAAKSAEIPWQHLLAQFFSGLRRSDFRFLPPAKRHLWRGIYLPSIGVPGPRHIVVAVDTSGSMSTALLGRLFGELDRLRSMSECTLTVLQCDAAIQDVRSFDAWELADQDFSRTTVRGRGGTSFEPIDDWLKTAMLRFAEPIDAVFVLTDGFGSFPRTPAPIPWMWVMPEGGAPKVPFGEILRIAA